MKQTTDTLVPLDCHQLAEGFRRLALLTSDQELAERMMHHADEIEQEAQAPRKAARH